jgi:hypothetical protein
MAYFNALSVFSSTPNGSQGTTDAELLQTQALSPLNWRVEKVRNV